MTNGTKQDDLDLDVIDSLLDSDLAGIEDLPDYVTPPEGFYKLKVKVDLAKEFKGKRAIGLTFNVIETIALNNAAEEPVKEGSLFSQMYFPDTSVEKQHMWRWLKKAIKYYSTAVGATSLKQALVAMDEQIVTAKVTLRPNEEKTQWYPQVDNINPA